VPDASEYGDGRSSCSITQGRAWAQPGRLWPDSSAGPASTSTAGRIPADLACRPRGLGSPLRELPPARLAGSRDSELTRSGLYASTPLAGGYVELARDAADPPNGSEALKRAVFRLVRARSRRRWRAR
jgi:hypothetical protein